MTILVVDASAMAALLFGEPEERVVADRLRGCELHAPALLPFELANIAVKKIRRGEMPEEAALEGLARFGDLDVALQPVVPEAVAFLAIQTGLTGYDASYLWLSRTLDARLETLDKKLRTIANGT